MKKALITILLGCRALCSFAQNKPTDTRTPERYYEEISLVTNTLYTLGIKWSEEFSYISGYDKNFARLAELMRYPEAYAGKKAQEFKAKPGTGKGGKKLNDMMITFLNFEKEIISKSKIAVEKLDTSSGDEEIEAVRLLLAEQAKAEAPYIEKILAAQSKYSDDNGVEIPPPASPQ